MDHKRSGNHTQLDRGTRPPVAAFSGNHATDKDQLQLVATGLSGSLSEDWEKIYHMY